MAKTMKPSKWLQHYKECAERNALSDEPPDLNKPFENALVRLNNLYGKGEVIEIDWTGSIAYYKCPKTIMRHFKFIVKGNTVYALRHRQTIKEERTHED
jgi:hypothetical protein